jgi:hypothetical protein
MNTPKEWTYSYQDISKATGQTYDVVAKHYQRKKYNPADLRSVVKYIVQYSGDAFRIEILKYLATRPSEDSPGVPKPTKRGRKKKLA